ncbi:MAG TPA: ABC transporter substrate-binding protein, partial [Trueperaceae bacterium]|nr:ABC transporter substrate-binding protein [Trueperaceae bacterium]
MGRILMTAALAVLAGAALAQPVTITWFVGLGAGAQPEQQAAQDAIVERFNAEHDDIRLEIVYVTNEVSVTTLSTLIATGEAPDIVGPVGGAGSAAFAGNFLDLTPLIESTGYDLSQFPEAAVDNQR